MELNFRNTEVSFAHLSDKDLKKAKRIFSLMNQTNVVSIGSRAILKALKWGLPLSKTLHNTLFDRFCGGETIEEALEVGDTLLRQGIRSCLHYAVDSKNSGKCFDRIAEKTTETVIRQSGLENQPSLSVLKLSDIVQPHLLEKSTEYHSPSEKIQFKAFLQRLERICSAAHNHGGILLIEAEESWLQVAIDELAISMMRLFNQKRPVVYTTVQMYRKDGLLKLKNLIHEAKQHHFYAGLKIVRGAYLTQETQRALSTGIPSPIHTSKEATDQAYSDGMRYIFENLQRAALFAASHNESSMKLYASLAQGLDCPTSRVLAGQYYGMADHITYQLGYMGLHVCKYIPFGPLSQVVPPLLRRVQENRFMAGEWIQELELIQQEIKRRQCYPN